jgi:hypothetical protein
MDNFYNSPDLAWFMKKERGCIGTLRADSQNVPPVLKNRKLKKGEHCGQHSRDMVVLAWQNKKRVTMVSTHVCL